MDQDPDNGEVLIVREGPLTSGDVYLDLVAALTRLGREACQRILQFATETGVRGADFWVLWMCGRTGGRPSSQCELSAALGLSAAHVSGIVEQLRRQGLLVGGRDPLDRRRQIWRVTEAGADHLRRVVRAIETAMSTGRAADPREAIRELLRPSTAIAPRLANQAAVMPPAPVQGAAA